MIAPDERQQSLLAPDDATIIHLVRENLRLLETLVLRYEVERMPFASAGPLIQSPDDVAAYLGAEMSTLAQEQLRAVSLDIKNRIIGVHLVYQGGANAIVIRLADCFREAVRVNAATLVLVHNHPSGNPEPSGDDCRLTKEAGQVGELLGIELIDHLIIGRPGFVSLRRRGLYTPPGALPSSRHALATAETPQ